MRDSSIECYGTLRLLSLPRGRMTSSGLHVKNAFLTRLPNLIDRLSALEGLDAAFHDADDLALARLGVDTARMHGNLPILGVARGDRFRVAEHRKIRVVSREDKLVLCLDPAQKLDDLFVNGLAVEIIFGLIDEQQVIFFLL